MRVEQHNLLKYYTCLGICVKSLLKQIYAITFISIANCKFLKKISDDLRVPSQCSGSNCTSNTRGILISVPGEGTKILHAM